MNKRLLILRLFFCLCGWNAIVASAQVQDEFTCEAPDKVVEGDTVTVRYILETNALKGYLSPAFEGFEFIDMQYDIRKGDRRRGQKDRFEFIYRLRAVSVGLNHIEPMKVACHGKEIMSTSLDLLVEPGGKHEYATGVVRSFLEANGIDSDTCRISYIYDSPEFSIVSGVKSGYFVVTADESYGLEDPILAYSFEYGLHDAEPEFLNLLDYYKEVLPRLTISQMRKSEAKAIVPLLSDIAWGQKWPYNSECPMVASEEDTLHAVAGCGPVAIGQVMKYYGHPRSSNPASLLADLGTAVEAVYGAYTTSSNSGNYRKAMVRSFNFAPQCRLLTMPQEELFSMTLHELQQGRPVIVMNDSHAFICDGYDDGFLHFNLGWSGPGNGYFRLFDICPANRNDMLYHSMFIRLSPAVPDYPLKSVTLDKKTRLEDILTADEMENLDSLAIAGRLTGKDIRILRRMAGAVDDKDYFSWSGSLRYLDLSKASFVNDKDDPYLIADAAESKLKLWRDVPVMSFGMAPRVERVEYDFTFMTEDQWDEIVKYRMHVADGFRVVKNGSRYQIELLLEKRKAGRKMFADCVNLKQVVLPEDVIEVSPDAFVNTDKID